jgi:NAD(P)H-flavin reductase
MPLMKDLRVSVVNKLAPALYYIKLDLPLGENLSILPGQYMNWQVAPIIRRSYSMANFDISNGLGTYIDTTPGGPGSLFVERLQVGDMVNTLLPLGKFVYEPGTTPVYFIATGTGIVPILAMLDYALVAERTNRPLHLIYGVRTQDRLLVEPQLEAWAAIFPNFTYQIFVSQPLPNWAGQVGRVTAAVPNAVDLAATYYICGGRHMIDTVEQQLIEGGVSKTQIKYEAYY